MSIIFRSDAELIFFLHIPKAAETTLWSILEKQYGPLQRRLKHGTITAKDDKVRKLLASGEAEKLKLIGSHIPFGAHEMTSRSTSYFSLLRDPVKWVCSIYGWKTPFYLRKNVGSNVKTSHPSETIELIRTRNTFDIGSTNLQRNFSEEEIERFGGARLKREVSLFHLKNKIAGHLSAMRRNSKGGQS